MLAHSHAFLEVKGLDLLHGGANRSFTYWELR